MFPSFDTSFISKNCDWKGCNLGIRLNKNFCNKPLLFCLMVRQKDVYTCILMLTQRICARPRCCMKKAAMVLFNGPASRKALVENKCCILERHEKHVLFKKNALFCLLVRYHRCVRNRPAKSDRPQKEGA